MYNIFSLTLGLLAWGFGIAAIVKRGKISLVFSSLTACGISLTIQFFEIRSHVFNQDSSWFLDVMPTLATVAAFLVVTTVGLNFIALIRSRLSRN